MATRRAQTNVGAGPHIVKMSVTFRVVAWNLRASMATPILAELCADDSVDVFVLSEYRVPKAGDHVAARLPANGWPHAMYSATPARLKGVAIYSRHAMHPAPELIHDWQPVGHDIRQWIVSAYVPAADLCVLGVYVPFADGPLRGMGRANRRRAATFVAAPADHRRLQQLLATRGRQRKWLCAVKRMRV